MVDLAPYLCPANGQRYSLLGSFGAESCQVVKEPSGYFYQVKNNNAETLWYDDQYIYRGLDTSEGSDQCYAQYTELPDGTLRYGAPWLKRHINVGESFARNPMVVHYAKADGKERVRGKHPSSIQFVRLHSAHRFGNGQSLADVIELRWDAGETYFYHKSFGLVGFIGIDGRFSEFHPAWQHNPPVRSILPWFSEPVPPPTVVVTPPPPPSVPTLPPDNAPGWVDRDASSTGNVTNVRAQPNTTSTVVGAIAARPTPVRLYPDAVDMTDGKWNPVIVKATSKKGWVRSDVVRYTDPTPPPDVPYLKLDVPFVSQLGNEAGNFNNDCGVACASMLLRYKFSRLGLGTPALLTVNDMALKTSLTTKDDGLTLAELVTLLAGYGIAAEVQRPLTPNRIIELLDTLQPVLALVKYGHFNPPDPFDGGHFVIVTGYGERGFWCHDPYNGGRDFYVTRETLDKAMQDVLAFAAFPYQGVLLT